MSDEDDKMEINETENSDFSSDDNDGKEQVLIDRAEELEKEISSNKYLYDAHVELVELYRKLGDLSSMRAAYQRFHDCFPLAPKLWLAWIKDEIKLASSESEIANVFKLFDKASEDYLSVEIWIEYAQYSIGVSDLSVTRSILERGLTAAGLHCSEGSLVWDTLRELEHAHISLQTAGTDEWKAQVNRLADVFKRHLSVPLLNMENTYSEWQEWFKSLPEGTVNPEPVEWGYKKALKLLEIYEPFEGRLLVTQDNEELYSIYKEYIKAVADPSTKICLYERAALQLCLVPSLWLDYCMFAFKLGEAALKISSRALRNCPWSEELWIIKLQIMENLGKHHSEVLECFEQGLTSITSQSLELWLSFIEYVCRSSEHKDQIHKVFGQAMDQIGFEHDPSCKLARLHARIYAKEGDMISARKVWKNVLNYPQNKGNINLWLEYANLEREFGAKSHLRILFQKALSACSNWPQYIADEWLMYERQYGTLEDVLKCIEKCRELVKVEAKQQAYQQSETNTASSESSQKSRKRKIKEDGYPEKKKPRSERREEKIIPTKIDKPSIDKDPKKTVFVSNLYPSINENKLKELFPNAVNIDIVYDRKGKSRCYGYVQFTMEEEVMTALARDREPLDGRPIFISEIKTEKTEKKQVFKYAMTVEKNKLFVRGLPIKKTHEEIKEIFLKYGAIDVRLVLHKSGQPKGLAYIEFPNEEAANKALKETDQMEIDGHKITVAISAPPPKQKTGSSSFNKDEPIRHARSRLQVPLIPRSLQVKPGEKKEQSNGNSVAKPRSNAEFRDMLLKK